MEFLNILCLVLVGGYLGRELVLSICGTKTPYFDFVEHLRRQKEFSAKTFGPGRRVKGVVDHIKKELVEVEASGGCLSEWTDVIILGLDGALRSGADPKDVISAIRYKQAKNEARKWPDWRTADPNKAIGHDRSEDGGGP